MKKLVLLIAVFAITSSNIFAQTLHLRGGMSFSHTQSIIYSPERGTFFNKPKYSYSIMADLEYLTQSPFSLITGLHFYNTGANFDDGEHIQNPKPLSFKYISLHHTFNFAPVDQKIKWQFSFGPHIDYIVHHNTNYDNEILNKVNLGFCSGTGVYYKVNDKEIGVQVLYYNRFFKTIDSRMKYPGISEYYQLQIEDHPVFINFSYGFKI